MPTSPHHARRFLLAASGLILSVSVAVACGGDDNPSSSAAGSGGAPGDDAGSDAAAGQGGSDAGDSCKYVEEVTGKVYVTFVIHNEEDDAGGVPGSVPDIPDYNGDEAVFRHFAGAMFRYAKMLASVGVKLSFQPDWTFTEGVDAYERSYFRDLLELGNVEVLPHAHETVISYDVLHARLNALDAEAPKIFGGMTFDAYRQKQAWFDANPGWTFWAAPSASPGHVDDAPMPPFAYRVAAPGEVSSVSDLRVHRASSPIVVTPGLPGNPVQMLALKPEGRFVTPAYFFHATREFLADPSDTSVPPAWRKRTDGSMPPFGENLSAQELIEQTRVLVETELLPLAQDGKVEFVTVRELIELYEKNESCLDLQDGEDLTGYVP